MPRFLRIHEGHDPSCLRLDELPLRDPLADEVRIRVQAFGMNYGDLDLMEDNYPFLLERPSLFGDEAAGVVDALGPEATNFAIGDRVDTLPWMNKGYGVNGEYAFIPQDYVVRRPENMSPEQGAAIWVQYLTAYYAIYTAAKIQADDFVLNCAASSSAGIGATQLAKLAGATVIGTSRTFANKDFLLETGCDHVIATQDEDVSARISEITGGKGARIIYDPVGGPLTEQYADGLANNAIIFLYGSMADQPTVVPINEMIRYSAILQPHSVYQYIDDPDLRKEAVDFVHDALASGQLVPLIDQVFDLNNYREAFEYQVAAKARRGKLVIKVQAPQETKRG